MLCCKPGCGEVGRKHIYLVASEIRNPQRPGIQNLDGMITYWYCDEHYSDVYEEMVC